MEVEFDVSELDEFTSKLVKLAIKEMPKETNKFMRKEGNKLKGQTIKTAKNKLKNYSSDPKSYMKSIKRGRVYNYNGDEKAIRVYSSAPHGHLIEYGHVLVKGGKRGKGGKEIGFVRGKNIFKNSKEAFKETFYKDNEKFIDDMLDKGL